MALCQTVTLFVCLYGVCMVCVWCVSRESRAADTLLAQLPPLLPGYQRRRRLRQVCSEEWLWRCHANLSMGLAHLGTLRQNLEFSLTVSCPYRYTHTHTHTTHTPYTHM